MNGAQYAVGIVFCTCRNTAGFSVESPNFGVAADALAGKATPASAHAATIAHLFISIPPYFLVGSFAKWLSV
jgi:hypothetical protein